MNNETFATYLKWLRKEFKLTQQQLADELDCANSTISRYESGQEMPSRAIFMRLNMVFEPFGVAFDEVWMEHIFRFKDAKRELLKAIKNGRCEELHRKLDKLYEYMEETKDIEDEEKLENMQYYALGHLITIRNKGLGIEQFLDEIIAAYELRRRVPDFEDIPKVKLSHIEYQLLYEMAEAHRILGNTETAETICKGLMLNNVDERSPFVKDKYVEVSFALAKVCMLKMDYKKVLSCLIFIFDNYISNTDTRTVIQSLMILWDLCEAVGDTKGAGLIKDFLENVEQLMGYMYDEYGFE